LSSAEFSLKEKKKHFSLFRKFTRKSQVFLKIYFKKNYTTKLKLTRIPALPPLPNSKHHHFLFTEIFSKKKRPKVEKNPKICHVSTTHSSSKQASSQDIKGF